MDRRGFSLLEMVIVLGVMVALGAVAFAGLFDLASGTRFDEGARRVRSALALARADAQREQRALCVVVAEIEGVTWLMAEPFERRRAATTDAEHRAAGAARRLVELPRGVRLERAMAAERDGLKESGAFTEEGAADHMRPEASAAVEEGVRLCVLLPDGSAWPSDDVQLVGAGRRSSIAVNRWTGTARIAEVDIADAAEEAASAAAEPREPAGRTKGDKR